MPSGSYVAVFLYTNPSYTRNGTYMNLYVYPLKEDAYQTTGLCGNYNLDSSDDGPSPGSTRCTATCEMNRRERFFCHNKLLITNFNQILFRFISLF